MRLSAHGPTVVDRHLIIDARSVHHATAGGRGIGNYTRGLISGLVELGVPTTVLVDDAQLDSLELPTGAQVRPWSRQVIRQHASPGTWYVATGMFLHPIAFDPIPMVVTEARLPVVSVMYDVIPYRYPERYLVDHSAARLAALRGPLARSVDLTVAISQFAARTAIDVLALPPAQLAVIGGAAEDRFGPPTSSSRRSSAVVAVTGSDPRKNTEGLLEAWSLLPGRLRDEHHLTVVASASDGLLARWRRTAVELDIAGTVDVVGRPTDGEMVEFLQRAALVVQPSLEEGFGLPVVEAARCGAIVICSNVSSLPEILDEPAATFDPYEPRSIAAAIERALTDAPHRQVLLRAARAAADRWRWPRVASMLVDAVRASTVPTRTRRVRPRIAVIAAGEDAPFDALHNVTDVDIVELWDPGEGIDLVPPDPTRRRWPAGAWGSHVHPHDVDEIVCVLAGRSPGVAHRVVAERPVHVWVRTPDVAKLPMLSAVRSVVVDDSGLVEPLRERCAVTAPIHVLGGDTPATSAAELVRWVWSAVTSATSVPADNLPPPS
jgi:glycosyltransferase involved in cell wall biosynthesis